MNPSLTASFWMQGIGVLTFQVTLVIALAATLHALTAAAAWRRRIWLASLVILGLVVADGFTGYSGFLTRPLTLVKATPSWRIQLGSSSSQAPVAAQGAPASLRSVGPSNLPNLPRSHGESASSLRWPAWLWLAGALVVLLRLLLPRLLLGFSWRRHDTSLPADATLRLHSLIGRLGIRRKVRVLTSSRLPAPVAFGILRPTIGLPVDFWTRHSAAEQEVMLAHELAHLAARDSLGLGMANVLVISLWWHPLVWCARRQFHAACEAAADEASVVVENGPEVLAACLVDLASRWRRGGAHGLPGMAGFRSGLGRRVEHLLNLQPARQPRPQGVAVRVLFWLGATGIVVATTTLPAASQARTDWFEAMHQALLNPSSAGAVPSEPAPPPLPPVSAIPSMPAAIQIAPVSEVPQATHPLPWVPPVPAKPTVTTLATSNSVVSGAELKPLAGRVTSGESLSTRITAPPQVLIEAKFVEITQEDSGTPGAEWLLGTIRNSNAPAISPSSGVMVSPGVTVFPGAVALPGAATTGTAFNPGHFAAPTHTGALSSAVREVRGDQLDWPGRKVPNAANIRVTAAQGAGLTGLISDEQLTTVMRALEKRPGVSVLASPKVLTLSGRQAQLQMVELQTVVTGVNPEAMQEPKAPNGTNAPPFTTATLPFGPTLDITPVVSVDGHSIQLNVMPTVTEFMGYDAPPKGSQVRIWEAGHARLVDVPLPRLRLRQMVTDAVVSPGQTLVLGGLIIQDAERDKDGAPAKPGKSVKRQLMVFVTPKLVDPAGNPIKASDLEGSKVR